jgi:oxalate decarboxylase/phosphoglucose isomerase-like protein (cupin superfamily)
VLYVLSGEGDQMVDDGAPFRVRAGDTIYVGAGVYHSTQNTGWSPMHVLALYNPPGPERVLEELPDFRRLAGGEQPVWKRG